MELNNKVVLITGASTGLGKAMAKIFLEKGSKVIVFGLNKPSLDVEFHKVNVSKENEIKSALSKIKKIDVLINNAGIAKVLDIKNTDDKDFEEMFKVNFNGTFWMSKYSASKLNEGASIINISSVAGIKSFEGYGVYSATKSAVISLTKTLALELSPKKIRVNCIAPGVIETEIWEKMHGKDGKKMLNELVDYILVGRVGKPEEVAHAAIFLAENEYVNGQVIVVDGGEIIK